MLTLLGLGFASGMGGVASEEKSSQDKTPPLAGQQRLQSAELSMSTSVCEPDRPQILQLGDIKPVDPSRKETLNYWLFLPKNESAKTTEGFPLLLFLHGAGERGGDPENVKVHGPPMLIETGAAETWPFLTLSPHCPKDQFWSPGQLVELIDHVAAEYPVDRSRVYVTGLSMGGYGTWMLLATASNRIAAAVPICGGGSPEWATNMLDVPIWVYHGASDSVVTPRFSEEMVQAIWSAGGKKVKLTEYVGVDHDSWTPTYANPKLYEWLLQQKKIITIFW